MKNSSFLQPEFRTALAAFLFTLSTLLAGCASLVEKGKLPEVVARCAPDIQPGTEFILLLPDPRPVATNTVGIVNFSQVSSLTVIVFPLGS